MVARHAIKRFSDEIARRFKPEKIVLFGSYAYGKPTPDSDVDLLVVMPYDRRKGRMSLRILEAMDYNFPLDQCSPRVRCSMKPLTREWIRKAEPGQQTRARLAGFRSGRQSDYQLRCGLPLSRPLGHVA